MYFYLKIPACYALFEHYIAWTDFQPREAATKSYSVYFMHKIMRFSLIWQMSAYYYYYYYYYHYYCCYSQLVRDRLSRGSLLLTPSSVEQTAAQWTCPDDNDVVAAATAAAEAWVINWCGGEMRSVGGTSMGREQLSCSTLYCCFPRCPNHQLNVNAITYLILQSFAASVMQHCRRLCGVLNVTFSE